MPRAAEPVTAPARPPGRRAALPRQEALPADGTRYAPDAGRPVRVTARRLRADTHIVPHRHDWAQIAFSATGVLRVTALDHTYIVPPSRAVWIPPGIEHVVAVVEDAELRTLYLLPTGSGSGPQALADGRPGAAPDWRRCRVLEVSALLRELVQQLAAGEERPDSFGPERRRCLSALVQDELARARVVPLGVGLPADKRLRALCEAVLDDPAHHATLHGLAAQSGASVRTVARLFRQELGTTYAEWRQQVLLAKALSMAARKRPMSHIASELGYASASAFTAMVRRSVGEPPSRFFAAVA